MTNIKPTWLCPLCSEVPMEYGTSCDQYPKCGRTLTAVGEHYWNRRKNEDVPGLGISAISDE